MGAETRRGNRARRHVAETRRRDTLVGGPLLPPLLLLLLTLLLLLLLQLLPPLLLLLLPPLSFAAAVSCCRKAVVADSSPLKVAKPSEEHAARVVKLLIDNGTIGLGEVAQNQVSMVITLRYAVLQIAQSFAYYCVSALSICTGLAAGLTCTTDDDDTLPEGATKYLVVEFNAWVYSGVRCCVEAA